MLHIDYDAAGALGPPPVGAIYADRCLTVTSDGMHPAPRLYRMDSGRIVVLAGHPIAAGRRSDQSVLDDLRQSNNLASFARGLNGSFIIILYDPKSGTLQIINDRFAGLALYYAGYSGRTVIGTNFRKVLLNARRYGGGQIDAVQVWSFLSLRRLLAESTFAADIAYLRSASILHLSSDGGLRHELYWQPDLSTVAPSGRQLVDSLAEQLRSATTQHMSDDRRFGLLLSGGLDSRALLAAAPRAPICFTTCLTRNNEYAVAEGAAVIAGAEHYFIERPAAPHDKCLDEAAALAGMQVYNEMQFLGYGPHFAPHVDVVMIGLGLDVFFGGLYLPKKPGRLFGRDALWYRLLPLPDDLEDFYLKKVKYRLQTSDPAAVLRDGVVSDLHEGLRSHVRTVMDRGRALGGMDYSLWEYVHVHNMSRHYSFPMMSSVRTFSECRAPGLDNDLFNLALSMRPDDKLNGTPYQKAIARLNPDLMKLCNANTNLPAGWSLQAQTWAKVASIMLSWQPGMARRSPPWQERSWPLPRIALQQSPAILARVATLSSSPTLLQIGIFDPGKIRRLVDEHITGQADHAVLLNLLLTLDSVLRPETSGD